MDFQHGWTFNPDQAGRLPRPTQQSVLPPNTVYSQKPNRIAKSSVRTISPRNPPKRKAQSIPHAPSRARSVLDRRPTFPQWQSHHAQPASRPVSWHPATFAQNFNYQYQGQVHSAYEVQPFVTTDVHTVVTPLSVPLADEPYIQGISTPLDELPANGFDQQYVSWNDFSANPNPYQYWPQYGTEKLSTTLSSYPNHSQYSNDYDHMYSRFNATKLDTAPSSPTILPIQDHNSEKNQSLLFHPRTTSGVEELVGMGLYDSPAEIQSSSLLFGGRKVQSRGSVGKGLKLEDSFEPPDVEDEADDDQQSYVEDYDENQPEQSSYVMFPESDLSDPSFYFEHDVDQAAYLRESAAQSYAGWEIPQYNTYGWF